METSTDNSDANDCNTPCGGAKSEACGGGNRILIYENPDYVDPTNDNYVIALKAWRDELDKVRGLIADFYKLVTIYNGQQGNPSKRAVYGPQSQAKTKRDPPGILLTQIMNARDAVSSARPLLCMHSNPPTWCFLPANGRTASASNLFLTAAGRARATRVVCTDGFENHLQSSAIKLTTLTLRPQIEQAEYIELTDMCMSFHP